MEQLSRVTGATIAVLTALVEHGEPCWGLAVIKASGRPAGSVYPILERLESAGWISSTWEADTSRSGPRRRYYELTDDGAVAARSAIASFRPRDAAPARVVLPNVVMPRMVTL
jgi:PadR family transcriptional regulator, regulatory protein PadR